MVVPKRGSVQKQQYNLESISRINYVYNQFRYFEPARFGTDINEKLQSDHFALKSLKFLVMRALIKAYSLSFN